MRFKQGIAASIAALLLIQGSWAIPVQAKESASSIETTFSTHDTGNTKGLVTTSAADTTAPVLESIFMAKTNMVELRYNEQLDPSSTPSKDDFKVVVNNEERPLIAAVVVGKNVQIYLESGVAIGQVIKVTYLPGSKPIKDLSGNRAPSFSSRDVSNTVEDFMNKIVNATVTGKVIQMTFSDEMLPMDNRGVSQFTVMVDGKTVRLKEALVSGFNIVINLEQDVTDGQAVKVQYKPGSYPIRDRNNAPIMGFGPVFVRNTIDTKPPILESSRIDGSRLTLNYNEGLNEHELFLPMKSHYSVLVNDKAVFVNKVEVKSNMVILTLASSVSSLNDKVTVSYVPGPKRIVDLNGNAAPGFSLVEVGVVKDSDLPSIEKATFRDNVITLDMTGSMDQGSVPSKNYFNVKADNRTQTISNVQVNNTQVIITLSKNLDWNQSVVISYSAPGTKGLMDTNGSKVKSFSNQKVEFSNSSGSGSGSGSSGAVLDYVHDADWKDFLQDVMLVDTVVASKLTDRSLSGQYVNRYNVNNDDWAKVLDQATKDRSEVVALDLSGDEKAAMVAIGLKPLEDMVRKNGDLKVGVRYGDWLYSIKLSDIPFNEIRRQLLSASNNTTLLFQIERQPSRDATGLINGIRTASGTSLVEPVMFSLTAYSSAGKESEVTAKTHISYQAGRMISGNEIAVVRQNPTINGKIAYIPTHVKSESSSQVVNSMLTGNSAIAIARSNMYFTDINGHWGMNDIQALSGRFIADAVVGTRFEPNKAITRGDFAVLIAKGIGLDGDLDASKRFRDVSTSSAAAPYIGAAVKAGIISGHADGTFKPESVITREQIALMMNRTLIHTGNTIQLSRPVSQWMASFTDRNQISTSAQDAVAKTMEAGIIQGLTYNTFGPRQQATRAQAAVMVKRLLEYIEYM
ncbi:SwmB domain-containing protein [Paenibacillus sp. 1001270B_150601_E10]|uniref:SwmB domain-containing protein n=1 Tax=Paenibacillus sp. 1001270B_150601_E10 TaxID=2787079 RepID=UPI0018A015A2|nr:SwmB domain-containing protein [Paenibacillus sp. 1001270B_150601_E10]